MQADGLVNLGDSSEAGKVTHKVQSVLVQKSLILHALKFYWYVYVNQWRGLCESLKK